MSALDEALRPIAEKFGGSAGICAGPELSKPGMMVSFNDAASAESFVTEAKKALSARKWWGAHKLPGANFKQQ